MTAPPPKCPHCKGTGKIKIPHPLKPVSKRIVTRCERCDGTDAAVRGEK